MTTLIALSFLIITTYIVYIIKVIGLRNLPSLSESYYTTKWKFQLSLFFTAALLIPVILEVTLDKYQFLAFFSVAPILFVSVAPKFKNKDIERKVHIFSAQLAAISSLFWSAIMLKLLIVPLLLILIILGIVVIRKYSNKVFVSELICFIIVYITLFLKVSERL